MNRNYYSNRQIPLAPKYEDEILREEMRAREAIMAERCKGLASATPKARRVANQQPDKGTVKSIEADVVYYVSTHMKDNPGPGAFAVSVTTVDGTTKESGYYADITGPLLELEAMNAALLVTRDQPGTMAIHTTARWIADYLNDGTAERWKAHGWQKTDGTPLRNAESWATLMAYCEQREVKVAYVRHGATSEMRHCDDLAMRTYQS